LRILVLPIDEFFHALFDIRVVAGLLLVRWSRNCIKFWKLKFKRWPKLLRRQLRKPRCFWSSIKTRTPNSVSVNGIETKYGRIKGNDVRHACVGRRSEIFQWGLAFFSQTARFFTSLHGRRYS
jgi:hypothetical protein